MRGINRREDWGWANAPRFGSDSTPSTTTSSSAPWAGQQPYLSGLFAQASDLANNYQPQYYPGSTYASITPGQQNVANQMQAWGMGGDTALSGANNMLTGIQTPGYTGATQSTFDASNPTIAALGGGSALQATQPTFNQSQGYLSNMLSGATLDPSTAPGFQSLVNQTMATVMPATDASFNNAGRADSGLASAARTSAATNAVGQLGLNYYLGQQQLQQGAAQQAAANQATGLNATLGAGGLASSNLLNTQGNQLKAAGLAPAVSQGINSDLGTAMTGATTSQTDQQNAINAAIQKFNFNQMEPWNLAGMYQGLINGNYGSQGTATTPYYQNPTANALGAATGLLGVNAATGTAGQGFSSTALGSLYNSIFNSGGA